MVIMSSKECEAQLNELLEAWDLDEATLNQTDIEAIKHLLLENQIQQDVIISYKTTNLDQAVDIQQLEQENQQLKEMFEDSKTYSKEFLYKHNKNLLEANEKLQQQRDKYKEVIEEVRKTLINSKEYKMANAMNLNAKQSVLVELLQILDKAKEVK